jgi:hypothetical protein
MVGVAAARIFRISCRLLGMVAEDGEREKEKLAELGCVSAVRYVPRYQDNLPSGP